MQVVGTLKIDSVKLIVAMARKGVNLRDVIKDCGSLRVLYKGLKQPSFILSPKNAGRISNYLGVDVTEIMAVEADEKGESK